jgi:uncharacterized protein YllA (UPF0747 family)
LSFDAETRQRRRILDRCGSSKAVEERERERESERKQKKVPKLDGKSFRRNTHTHTHTRADFSETMNEPLRSDSDTISISKLMNSTIGAP